MVEITNPKPPTSFLNQLLDNKPSDSPQAAEVTTNPMPDAAFAVSHRRVRTDR